MALRDDIPTPRSPWLERRRGLAGLVHTDRLNRQRLTEAQTTDLRQRFHAMRAEVRARGHEVDVADIMACFEDWVCDQPDPDSVRFLGI